MRLAINGGPSIRKELFPADISVGREEKSAAGRVIDSGVLSRFLGAHHPDFYGGPEVQALEAKWSKYFNVKHAISVNSNTSGLICAMGAIGIKPGDEVIVCAYSMSISAVAPLFYGGIPVFADIEPDYFCLDAESIEKCINERTRAIVVVDLFGQPYDAVNINKIAKDYGLFVIEDCAQAPGATYNGNYAGSLGDLGIFSLNYHKHIQCGEGGVVVTDSDQLADKLKLIRNHAESVAAASAFSDCSNMLGFNFRMTEIEAAIASEQLDKLEGLLEKRSSNVAYLEKSLDFIPGMHFAKIRPNCTHVHYQHAFLWNEELTGIHRNLFIDAVKAELPCFELRESEGVKLGYGYVKPLYHLPIFLNKDRSSNFTKNLPCYTNVKCGVVERLHKHELIHHEFIVPSMEMTDMDDVVSAFEKVWNHRDQIKNRPTHVSPYHF